MVEYDAVSWSKELSSFDKESLGKNQFSDMLINDIKRGNIAGIKPDSEVLLSKYRIAMIARLLGAPSVTDQWLSEIAAEVGFSVSLNAKLMEELNTQRLVSNRPAPTQPQQPQYQQ